jgi:hypothetical protein
MSIALEVSERATVSASRIGAPVDRDTAEIDAHLGKRLRTRRRSLWMTQTELASAVGVGFWQIHKYERGLNTISASRLWMLAEALGVSVEYFFSGLENRPAQSADAA